MPKFPWLFLRPFAIAKANAEPIQLPPCDPQDHPGVYFANHKAERSLQGILRNYAFEGLVLEKRL